MRSRVPPSRKGALLAVLLTACGCDELPPPGVVAPDPPTQVMLSEPRIEKIGEFEIKALAEFALAARVLSKESYYLGRESDLSRYDLALGWQRMSDSSVYGRLDISQSGRWYHYSWGSEGPPIPKSEIIRSSANMHIIPSTPEVEDLLSSVKRHDTLYLKGYLVAVRAPDGWRWVSSLSRADSGARSCEVFVVTKLVRTNPSSIPSDPS